MRAIDKLREVSKFLDRGGIEAAQREAEILLRHGLDLDTVELYRDNPSLSREEINNVGDMAWRRLRREPLQYILGYVEFLGLKLLVGPGILIPRPETELMAEQAIKTVNGYQSIVDSRKKNSSLVTRYSSLNILDVCTGSGCLALALAREFPGSRVCGTDISGLAIEYADMNAGINGIENVRFLRGSLFQPFEEMYTDQCLPSAFDLIISNPPYIKTGEISGLQPEIRDWEPLIALDGGADGLDFYKKLIPAARRLLKDEGRIMLELGAGQAGGVSEIIKSSGYTQMETIRDYSGLDRILQAKWKR